MKYEELLEKVKDCNRIVIVGRPGTGKTTLANNLFIKTDHRNLLHTDEFLKETTHTELPKFINGQLEPLASYIVEGTTTARMLKYGLEPDAVIVLNNDLPILPKHKGITTGVIRSFDTWRERNPDAPVFYVWMNNLMYPPSPYTDEDVDTFIEENAELFEKLSKYD